MTNETNQGTGETAQGAAKKSNVASLSVTVAVSVTMILISIVLVDTLYVGRTPIAEWFRWLVVAVVVWLGTLGHVGFSFGSLVAFLFIRSLMERFDSSIGSCFVVSVFGLAWLMWVARYETIRSLLTQWLTNFASPTAIGLATPSPESSARIRILKLLSPTSIVLLLLLLPILGTIVLYNQPWSLNDTTWLEWTLAYGQVLWPGPVLVTSMIGALVILNELLWRQKTPTQMQLYARSDAIKSMFSDLHRIVARKLRKK